MLARRILPLMLGMLVLPVFPQDEPPPNTAATREALEEIADAAERAEQGHAPSQYNLGVRYTNGQGVPQDYKEAVRWYRAAANQGYADAQNNLGFMYNYGQGVPQDYIQAHMWYNLAAASGGDDDREMAAKNRDLIAEKMTSEQIAEAQRLAREWKPKSSGS